MRLTRVLALMLASAAAPAAAEGPVVFEAPGASPDLDRALRGASLTLSAAAEGRTGAQDLFAAARGDYARLLATLYAAGHYAGVITIRLDGREAADIPPLEAPVRVERVTMRVDPGPLFTFGIARIAPLAPGTLLPEGFAPSRPAASGAVRAAAGAAVDGWRAAGHPRAAIGAQSLVARHPARELDADLTVAPGPLARFGAIRFAGHERMWLDRLTAIAGFPAGGGYAPRDVRRVADRLRRTGVFRAVTITEAERLGPGDTLDLEVALVEEAPRRVGFGAELASLEGLTLSGFWLHRNLFGGAERLRIEGEVAQIGAQLSRTDYRLGLTLERPATFHPDVTLGVVARLALVADRDQETASAETAVVLTRVLSERLTGSVGLGYRELEVRDTLSHRRFRNFTLPVGLIWDGRDKPIDATRGAFLSVGVAPYLGVAATNSGARVVLDARAFQPLGDRVVLAGRLQAGAVLADGIAATPRDYLFYSGGGGTVRGQPFQALGVTVLPGRRTGGMRFLGASAEIRTRITPSIGAVAFLDAGSIGATGFFDTAEGWHAGAGLGLRYMTPVGPIRLDVAAPAGGTTGRGVQIYIGIGQAF